MSILLGRSLIFREGTAKWLCIQEAVEMGKEQVCWWSPKAHEDIRKRKRDGFRHLSVSKRIEANFLPYQTVRKLLDAVLLHSSFSHLLFSEGVKEQLCFSANWGIKESYKFKPMLKFWVLQGARPFNDNIKSGLCDYQWFKNILHCLKGIRNVWD